MRDTNLSDLIGGALHRLIIEKGSTISLQRVIRIKSGQRNKIESIREVIYPGLFTSGDDGYATPTAHETRNLGTTVEVDPVFNDKGTVLDLDLSPEQVSHFGESIHHRILIGGEWKPNVTMPVFYTMKTTTQVTLPLDTYVLVSVMSPPDAEGRTDASRKVLLFVKVSR